MNKKQVLRKILVMAMWLLSPHCVYSQVSEHEMRLAVDILKGKDNARTKEWAVSTLERSLLYEKDAYALNVLGIAYLHGIGAEADTAKALSEVPVRLNATTKADSVACVWRIGADTIQTRAILSDDGALRFCDEEIARYDRYSSTSRSLYRFDEASISYADGMLTGSLRLYSIDEREPEKPMYVSLRKSSSGSDGDAGSRIYSYPNPYTDAVTLKFDLSEPSSSCRICLYTSGGVCKEVYNIGALEAGEHAYTIVPAPGEKTYVVHVMAGPAVYQTVIIRKGK